MGKVYGRTKNYNSISLAALDSNNGEILAVLQAVVIREIGGLLGMFSAWSIIQGGPLFIEDERGLVACKKLMEYYDKIAKKKAIFTQIRNTWDVANIDFFNKIGYEYEDHLNILVDLTLPIDILCNKISKSRRNGINRAKRRGVIIEEIIDESFIPIVYHNLQETYQNAKMPLADITLFENAFSILAPKNMAKFFLAKNEDP